MTSHAFWRGNRGKIGARMLLLLRIQANSYAMYLMYLMYYSTVHHVHSYMYLDSLQHGKKRCCNDAEVLLGCGLESSSPVQRIQTLQLESNTASWKMQWYTSVSHSKCSYKPESSVVLSFLLNKQSDRDLKLRICTPSCVYRVSNLHILSANFHTCYLVYIEKCDKDYVRVGV